MSRRKLQILYLTLLATGCMMQAKAQSEQVWAAAEVTKGFGKGFDLTTTFSWRQSFPEADWKRAVLQLGGSYSHKSFRFLASVAGYYTVEQGEQDLFELRPWQGIAATFPDWKRAKFVHFIRFEERFQKEGKDWSFSPRIRYGISTRVALTKKTLDDRTLYLYGALEWLNNFNKPLRERFSNTRAASIGLGFRFNSHSSVEAIYEVDVTDDVRENLTDVDVRILRLRWLVVLIN